jgi:YVTN family beta-propeller protein
MTPRIARSSIAARSWRRTISSLVLASLVMLAAAPSAQAATSTNSWLAKIGSSGANGTAAINAYTTGSGALVLKLKKLPDSRTLAVTLLKASCKGSTLLTLASIKTTSTGAAVRTSGLTASQATAIKKATVGTAKIAIRIGTGTTAKCGVFVVQLVPAYVAARVTVGRSPSSVAIDPTGVWVTNWFDNTLSRINPATNTVLATIPLVLPGTAGPEAITTGGGSLWVTTTEYAADDTNLPGSVLRIDPATGAVLATIAAGRGAYDIAYGYGAVWVTNIVDGNVQRIDPTTNQVVTTIQVFGAWGIAVDSTAVWVVNDAGTVTRIDPVTNQVLLSFPTQPTGAYIVAGNGSLWMSHPGTDGLGDGSVSRIDPATNAVIANIPVGDLPYELAVAGGSVWVGLNQTPVVVRINTATNTVLNRLTVGVGVYAIAATDHVVWAVHNYETPEGGTEPPIGLVTRVGF